MLKTCNALYEIYQPLLCISIATNEFHTDKTDTKTGKQPCTNKFVVADPDNHLGSIRGGGAPKKNPDEHISTHAFTHKNTLFS